MTVPPATVEIAALGPLEVRAGGVAVGPASTRRRRLLAALAVAANEVVPVDRLIEAVWDGAPPPTARASLQSHLSRLRTLLRGPGDGITVVGGPAGYGLEVDAARYDVLRYEALLARARAASGDPVRALALHDEADGLWRGPAFGEFADEDFARLEAARLEQTRQHATEDRMEAALAAGRHGPAVAELEAVVAAHPLRERAWGLLMVALYRCGRQADALATYQRLRRHLAEELGIEPSAPLRDLERAVLLQEPGLDAPGPAPPAAAGPAPGPSGTAPPAAAPGPPGNLVLPVSSFVGREREVAAVAELLAQGRAVTLTGPGGVGKTRLAVEVAARVAGRYPDGVFVCELARTEDPAAVAAAVASVLGVHPTGGLAVEEGVVDALRARRALLLLDNCEHVLEAAAPLVDRIARATASATVLATSRERLAVDGERVWPVGPLPVPPEDDEAGEGVAAVELFVDRARSAQPGPPPRGADRAAVVRICRALDGLPLALELAAARVAALGPAAVAARLEDRFELLARGARTADARHRTLRRVVEWSYGLLSPPERELFDLVAVFAGGFTLDAADAVCGDEGLGGTALAARVAALVEKSMVQPRRVAAGDRFVVLETLRAYGREQLEARGALGGLRARHAAHYTDLAAAADRGLRLSADEGRWASVLDAELDNLRAAHRWAVGEGRADIAVALVAALGEYAFGHQRDEVAGWAEAAVALPGAEAQPAFPAAVWVAAAGAANRGELARAGALAAGLLARLPPGHPGRIPPLRALADVALYEGRLERSAAIGRELTALASAAGDPHVAAMGCFYRALSLAYGGDVDAALEAVAEERRWAAAAGSPLPRSYALYAEGEALADRDPGRALELLASSRDVARSVGNRFNAAIAEVSLTSLQARHGDPAAALVAFDAVIRQWQRAGDRVHQWTSLRNLVELLARLGAHEPAAVLLGAVTAATTAPPLFGAAAARLSALAEALSAALGPDRMARLGERGAALTDDEAVSYALAAIRSRPPVTGEPPAPG